MGQYIVERTLSPETDRRIGIAASHLCRPVSFLADGWTRIRIGARVAVNASSGAMTPSEFFIGLVSNTSHAWASDYCEHAVGAWFGLTAATSQTNGCGIGFGYFTKRIAHTTTILNATALVYVSAATTLALTNTTVRNCGIVVEVVKKPGDIWALAMSGGRSGSTSTYGNQGETAVFDALIADSMTTVNSHLGTVGGDLEREATAGAVDETTYGTFNSICLYWRNPTNALEVCDISVSRLE